MLSTANTRSITPTTALIFGAFVFVSVLLGLMAALLPPMLVFAVVFLPLLFLVTWIYPGLALLVLVAVLYGVIPPEYVPKIPVAGGSFQANDLALGILALLVAIQSIGIYPEIADRLRPVAWPFALLGLLFLLSLIYAIAYAGNQPKHILAEARYFTYWFLLPVVVAITQRRPKTHDFILNGLVTIGALISVGLIVQHLTGVAVLGAGRVEKLVTVDQASDVVRTTTPGIYLVVLAIYFTLARWFSGNMHKFAATTLLLVLFLGLFVTFGRGVWFATALGAIFLAHSLGGNSLGRLVVYGAALVGALIAALFVLRPETGTALIERAFSIKAELERGSSAEWRVLENKYAIEILLSNPLVGVGLGGFAHPKFHPSMTDDLLRYVHNGYLYLAVKLGIFALIAPIALFVKVFRMERGLRQQVVGRDKAAKLALRAVFLVPFFTTFTQPEWMSQTGIGFLALVLGLMLSHSAKRTAS